MDKAIWQQSSPEQKVVLITLLMLANHKEKQWVWNGKKFEAKPGQFVTSLNTLAGKAGVSIRNVRTAIDRFEKLEFLTNQSTKTGRLITVLNWGVYQSSALESDKVADTKVTKRRQSTVKAATTTNNDKKENNDMKITYAESVTLYQTEYEALCSEHGQVAADKMVQMLNNYKLSSGKKYKSDYRAILSWVVGRYEKEQMNKPSSQIDVLKQKFGIGG